MRKSYCSSLFCSFLALRGRGRVWASFSMQLLVMANLVLQVIDGAAGLVLGVVIQDGVGVGPVEGPLDLQRANTHTHTHSGDRSA